MFTQLCAQRRTQMHSVSPLLSPGPTLNRRGIVGEGGGADGGGGGEQETPEEMRKRKVNKATLRLCRTELA